VDWFTNYVDWQPKFAYMHHAYIGAKAIFRHCKLSWLKALSTLIGENGNVMTRWRSFDLIYWPPSNPFSYSWHDDFAEETFPQGIQIHPSCEVLRVKILKNSWHLPIVLVNRQRQTLQILDLQNVVLQAFDLTTINPMNLRHISLAHYDVPSFRFLLSCPNLEHLSFQSYDPLLDAVGKFAEGQRDKIDD
jgi:hypothetical protein